MIPAAPPPCSPRPCAGRRRAGSSCGARPCATRANCWRCSAWTRWPRACRMPPRRSSRCACRAASSRACATAMPHDPLLRQVLPLDDEDAARAGLRRSTRSATRAARAGARRDLQKYRGRALLVATGSCAVHCRYCFRRHFPYAERNRRAPAAGARPSRCIARRPEHRRSDPVAAATRCRWRPPKLAELTDALAGIPHLQAACASIPACRSCCPTASTPTCCAWLRGLALAGDRGRCTPTTRNEFDAAVDAALRRACASAGATLLNQAVLLRGVNDAVDALAALSERGHRGRRAALLPAPARPRAGRGPLRGRRCTGLALHRALAARLSGYLVPRLVRELAGDPGKRPLV